MEKTREAFQNNLRRLRKARRLNQTKMAEKIDVSARTYQGYELGEAFPSPETLDAISRFFGVDVNELLATPRPPEPKPSDLSTEAGIAALSEQIAKKLTAALAKASEQDFDLIEAVEAALHRGRVSPRKRALVMALLTEDPSYIAEVSPHERAQLKLLLKAL